MKNSIAVFIVLLSIPAAGGLPAREINEQAAKEIPPAKRAVPVRPSYIFDLGHTLFPGNESGELNIPRTHINGVTFHRLGDTTTLNNRLHYGQTRLKTGNSTGDSVDNTLHSFSFFSAVRSGDLTCSLGVTNNSDAMFDSYDDVALIAMAMYRFYNSGPHSVSGGLLYLNRNIIFDFPFPIPMFGYSYIHKSLVVTAPMPVMVLYRPSPRVSFRFQSLLIIDTSLAVTWRIVPFLAASAEYCFKNENYYLKERDEADERLMLRYQRAGARLKLDFARNAGIFVYAGYQFDASYSFTKSMLDLTADRTSLDDSFLAEFGLQLRFY